MTGRLARGRTAVARTLVAVRATLVKRDARAVLVGVTLGYVALYLYILGHLRLTGDGGVSWFVVADPLGRAFQQMAPFTFEPVARLVVGPVEVLIAPVNVAIGGVLATLVGVNLAVSYLAWRYPAACGIDAHERATGLLAGLPALLSGTACCGPVVLIALGIQASSVFMAAFGFLVPAAVLLLVGSLLYVGRTVDPTVASLDAA